jgi:hypothetical protein
MRSLAFSWPPRAGGGAAVDEVHHRDLVVDDLQRGADAVVGQLHRYVVLLARARREVVRVRVVDVRVGVHEALEHVVGGHLVDALQHPVVALLEHLARLRPGLVGEQQRQRVVLDALAPQLVGLRLVLEPRRLGAVEGEALVDREVRLLVEVGDRLLDGRAVALLVAREDHERGLHVAAVDGLVELQAIALELGHVGREQVAVAAVE